MIQSWIHNNQLRPACAAGMRLAGSLSAGVCVDFDNSKYQPTLGGFDRLESKI